MDRSFQNAIARIGQPVPGLPWKWMRIMSHTGLGAGIYSARAQKRTSTGTIAHGSTLDLSTVLEDAAASPGDPDDAVVIMPNGGTLTADGRQYELCQRLPWMTDESPPRPVYTPEGGGSLPGGTGQYKCYQLIDALNPGTVGLDYVRLH